MVNLQLKEEWNCAITTNGGLSVMICGTALTLGLLAGNFSTVHMVSNKIKGTN